MSYCVYATTVQGVDLTGEVQLATREDMEQAVARMVSLVRREAQLTDTPLSGYAIDIDWHGSGCRTGHGAERGRDPGCRTVDTRPVT